MGPFPVGSSKVRSKQTDEMLMPKKNLVAIYEHLFKEGCMVAKKDTHAPKHPELDVPNLHVMKALTSLKSRGYVKEQFAWRHFYWYLTNEGIQYLRDYLHLPPEIVPATLKRQARTDARSRPTQAPSSGGFGGDKMIQTDQLIDAHQVQPMVPTRLVLLDQDLLPWNSEVDSVEGKQNKYDVSFTSSLRRSDYIFFFCDSKINLCKKRKKIKY